MNKFNPRVRQEYLDILYKKIENHRGGFLSTEEKFALDCRDLLTIIAERDREIERLKGEVSSLAESLEQATGERYSDYVLAIADREAMRQWLAINGIKSVDVLLERAEAIEARVRVLEEALRIARRQVITLHPAKDPRSIEPRDMQDQVQIVVLEMIDDALAQKKDSNE